jgi:transcriptional regulator with XRE-family HTH domain
MKIHIEKDIQDFHERVKEARLADGRSVQVLATLAEISVNYWYQIEGNKREWISADVLKRMQSVLGVDLGVNFNQPIAA